MVAAVFAAGTACFLLVVTASLYGLAVLAVLQAEGVQLSIYMRVAADVDVALQNLADTGHGQILVHLKLVCLEPIICEAWQVCVLRLFSCILLLCYSVVVLLEDQHDSSTAHVMCLLH